jgi:hypothetical protein
MTDALPSYVSIVFVLTTLLAIGFLLAAVRRTHRETLPQKLITFITPFWLLITAFLSLAGFYQKFDAIPPRILIFGALPAILLLSVCVFLSRRQFLDRLSLRVLTLVHIVRVPVELVLFWLYQASLVPRQMTLEGWNFDILSGISAPIVYWLAFRRGSPNRSILIGWNIAAFLLLINIVTIAVLSFKSPAQQIALDQPNVAVAYFPYIWLPAIVVPIVFFSHLASLTKLLTAKQS